MLSNQVLQATEIVNSSQLRTAIDESFALTDGIYATVRNYRQYIRLGIRGEDSHAIS